MGKSKTVQVYGFPSNVSAEAAQKFLELYTGEKTIDALKIRETKNGGARKYAIVQFTTVRAADQIISLAEKRLWYGNSYLNARAMDRDVIPKPRTFLHTMERLTIMFGCQISRERFSVLWKGTDALVKFGIGMRKINIFLFHRGLEYKLDLSYESIWQIELHRPRDQYVHYLLIQVGLVHFS